MGRMVGQGPGIEGGFVYRNRYISLPGSFLGTFMTAKDLLLDPALSDFSQTTRKTPRLLKSIGKRRPASPVDRLVGLPADRDERMRTRVSDINVLVLQEAFECIDCC
jgi:hypothetical protein